MKKYNYQDDFEMVYLRHEYASKCRNLDGQYIKEFAGVIHTTAKIMFNKLYPNLSKVGFDKEDIVNITSLYTLYYMELYSIRNNPERKEKYIKKYIERNNAHPSDAALANYDRNSLINFLRQRLHHLSTLSSRKARNITVGIEKKTAYAATENSIPVSNELLLENYKKYGYRKITQAELKKAKELAKEKNEQVLTDENGFKIIEVQVMNNGLGRNDYTLLFNTVDNPYHRDPEDVLERMQEDVEMEIRREKFNNAKKSYKRKKLLDFIEQNKDNKYLKKELTLARKLLSQKEIMV